MNCYLQTESHTPDAPDGAGGSIGYRLCRRPLENLEPKLIAEQRGQTEIAFLGNLFLATFLLDSSAIHYQGVGGKGGSL